MTFPHDQVQDRYKPEHHSLLSIVLVSIGLIAVGFAILKLFS